MHIPPSLLLAPIHTFKVFFFKEYAWGRCYNKKKKKMNAIRYCIQLLHSFIEYSIPIGQLQPSAVSYLGIADLAFYNRLFFLRI